MIVEYHRPKSLEEAVALLSRKQPFTVPLGGGTHLNRYQAKDLSVVDLQELALGKIETDGAFLFIGATVTLQDLLISDVIPQNIHEALKDSLLHEGGLNFRQLATIAGTMVSCDGRSPFATALLALDARLSWAGGPDRQPFGDFLPLREAFQQGKLITQIRFSASPVLKFMTVARTPYDRPIVCAAVATWPNGRTRVALGGHGVTPILAMDGPEAGGALVAAREAYRFAGDEWASAEYRMEIAGKLVQRMVSR